MCVKCIVDGQHNSAAAKMFVAELEGWDRTIQYLTDRADVHLTDEEHQKIIDLSGKMCDWADVIYKWVKEGNDVLRPIAIAHSFPNKK